jgi:hypothetical protein
MISLLMLTSTLEDGVLAENTVILPLTRTHSIRQVPLYEPEAWVHRTDSATDAVLSILG